MEQLVRIQRTHPDGTATVVHIRESACSGDCHKCSGCGAAKEAVVFTAANPIGARAGDFVRVESDSGPVLKGAAVLYMLPLVLFFLGYWLGSVIGWPGPLVGCLGFVLGVAAAVIYDRKVVRHSRTEYTITAFAESMKEEEHDHG